MTNLNPPKIPTHLTPRAVEVRERVGSTGEWQWFGGSSEPLTATGALYVDDRPHSGLIYAAVGMAIGLGIAAGAVIAGLTMAGLSDVSLWTAPQPQGALVVGLEQGVGVEAREGTDLDGEFGAQLERGQADGYQIVDAVHRASPFEGKEADLAWVVERAAADGVQARGRVEATVVVQDQRIVEVTLVGPGASTVLERELSRRSQSWGQGVRDGSYSHTLVVR